MDDMLREKLADYAHDAWSGWMKYMLSKTDHESITGGEIIPKSLVDRWTRQMNTPYADLPESEKKSDRKEADEMIDIMFGWIQDEANLERYCRGFSDGYDFAKRRLSAEDE